MAQNRPKFSRKVAVSAEDRPAVDREHLELLSIFHYIVGGLTVLLSCTFLALPLIGFDQTNQGNAAAGQRWLIGGIVGMVLGFILSFLLMLTGYFITKRRARAFTLSIAAIDLLIFPFGTLLGVFTFIVLGRDSIKLIYKKGIL